MAGIFTLSSTASENTSVGGVNVAEGCAAGNLNNGIRALAALLPTSFASGLENFFNGTSALAIASGGTGATSASAARTALGALADTYIDLPLSTQTGAFNFAPSMRAGAVKYTGAAASATIQPESTTAWGTTNVAIIAIYNNGSGALTIARGSGVSLKKNGATTSADATLAIGGRATLERWAADDWVINGTGVS